MVLADNHIPVDESMSPKPFDFPLDAAYLEYNGISSPFSAYSSYPYSNLHDPLSEPMGYTNALHLGLGDLALTPMDSSPVYSQHRPFTPVDSVAPSLTHMSPQQHSGSELSLDEQPGLRSTTSSPDSIREATALPSSGRVRSTAASAGSASRYNPIATPARSTRGATKKRSKTEDSEDEDEDGDFQPAQAVPADKREEVRKQRIESEQRRRDELREGYKRLKDALPPSNQKASKVALLDRAVSHIKYMEMTTKTLQQRLTAAERETAHLRSVNEALMLGTAEQRAAAAAASAAVQAQVQSSY